MRELEQRILKDGKVLPGNVLKVGSFLNQQVDTTLLKSMAKEVVRLFGQCGINKVVTIEASGIPLATMVAYVLECPLVVIKKHASANLTGDVYSTQICSFTHGNTYTAVVSKDYLTVKDKVLIVDDFLACGNAINGIMSMIDESGAKLVGCLVAIEKKFQGGGDELREKGIRVESLAMIDSMSDDSLTFYRKS